MKSKLQVNAKVVKWAIIILIPVIILLIPVNDVFTWQIKFFSASTLCAILMPHIFMKSFVAIKPKDT